MLETLELYFSYFRMFTGDHILAIIVFFFNASSESVKCTYVILVFFFLSVCSLIADRRLKIRAGTVPVDVSCFFSWRSYLFLLHMK